MKSELPMHFSLSSVKLPLIAILAVILTLSVAAQEPASAPIADVNDHRFEGVTEDLTSTAVTSGTHLRPMAPLGGFLDDTHDGYTVELLQLQWRWGDPLDVYILKPKGVKNPPVILNLYGYPADTDAYKN